MAGGRGGGGLVESLIALKRLIGVVALLGAFYMLVPWELLRAAAEADGGLSSEAFNAAVHAWASGLPGNVLMAVLLLLIAALMYGPEVFDLLGGGGGGNPPPGPRF